MVDKLWITFLLAFFFLFLSSVLIFPINANAATTTVVTQDTGNSNWSNSLTGQTFTTVDFCNIVQIDIYSGLANTYNTTWNLTVRENSPSGNIVGTSTGSIYHTVAKYYSYPFAKINLNNNSTYYFEITHNKYFALSAYGATDPYTGGQLYNGTTRTAQNGYDLRMKIYSDNSYSCPPANNNNLSTSTLDLASNSNSIEVVYVATFVALALVTFVIIMI